MKRVTVDLVDVLAEKDGGAKRASPSSLHPLPVMTRRVSVDLVDVLGKGPKSGSNDGVNNSAESICRRGIKVEKDTDSAYYGSSVAPTASPLLTALEYRAKMEVKTEPVAEGYPAYGSSVSGISDKLTEEATQVWQGYRLGNSLLKSGTGRLDGHMYAPYSGGRPGRSVPGGSGGEKPRPPPGVTRRAATNTLVMAKLSKYMPVANLASTSQPAAEEGKKCDHCDTTSSAQWFSLPSGEPLCKACNACLKRCQNVFQSPPGHKPPVDKKIRRKTKKFISDEEKLCSNCVATETTNWKRMPEGEVLCNPCYLYYKHHQVSRPLSMKRDVVHSRRRKRPFDTMCHLTSVSLPFLSEREIAAIAAHDQLLNPSLNPEQTPACSEENSTQPHCDTVAMGNNTNTDGITQVYPCDSGGAQRDVIPVITIQPEHDWALPLGTDSPHIQPVAGLTDISQQTGIS